MLLSPMAMGLSHARSLETVVFHGSALVDTRAPSHRHDQTCMASLMAHIQPMESHHTPEMYHAPPLLSELDLGTFSKHHRLEERRDAITQFARLSPCPDPGNAQP
ncbi:hypothetical protein CFE70_010029 [Pyrenophora teres f. teres 0-1]